MRKYYMLFLLVSMSFSLLAQLSSIDIRQASGHGPYPITISIQGVAASGKQMFSDFVKAYNDNQLTNGHDVKNPLSLAGMEGNLSVVIADNNFLGIKGFKVHGYTLNLGYRYLFSNLRDGEDEHIHLQEEVLGFKVGKRFNILYPLTCEIAMGPTFYNFYTTGKDSINATSAVTTTEKRIRFGNGLFERNRRNRELFSGLDIKFRLKFFDPAGTEGGMGGFIEYGRMITFGSRNLKPVYTEYNIPIGNDTSADDYKSWDYGYISAGLIFPLAIRMVSKS